ncbi:MAG: helix-turn-helix transcriptional regulator [Bacteroidota bacterium]|jgi:predicted DNA-binding transcriptional regulator YafY|nr:YafY family transcriptional regulator [Cytophagales bacterium]MCE2958445.1 YafY family transcriptional regulator [Flammeovirgaceae bacterium]MCZ8069740.1 YafY family protein [Cytophagales bacterium]
MNRIDRLTAILIQLQTKRIVKAEEIAHRFEISLRTVYRDIKALMEAGVPIGSEAGTGYFIVDGFHLPPVMFTQDEASAMMMAGKLVERMTDQSVRTAFENALMKVKAVLNEAQKDHLESLQAHIEVLKPHMQLPAQAGNHLSELQKAIADRRVVEFQYINNQSEHTLREVEPIGLFYYSAAWHLIAWCRLRNGFRDFRSDRIANLKTTNTIFSPRSISTLQEYLNSLQQSNIEMKSATLNFNLEAAQYVHNSRHYFGFVSEQKIQDYIQMKFLTADLNTMARWILSYGNEVEIESPEELKEKVIQLVEELHEHYKVIA